MSYPYDWPRCPVCSDFALDDRITCGRVECNESEQRHKHAGRIHMYAVELWRGYPDDDEDYD
jgi:predicted nucleic acid-binding Zn ribbon protein